MMKKVSLICFFLLFSMSWVFSQTVEKTTTLYPNQGTITQTNTNNYSYGGFWSLGADTTHVDSTTYDTNVYRSYYEFDLSAFEDSATITQVTVNYSMSGGGYTFKLTKITSLSENLQTCWNSINNGTVLHSGLSYGNVAFISNDIKTALSNALSSGELIIGVLSEAEDKFDSGTTLGMYLTVDYSIPAQKVNVTVRNDLWGAEGGNIGVAVHPASPVSRTSPYEFTPYEENKLNLAAYDNMTVNNKIWFFNNGEYPDRRSKWVKRKGFNSAHQSWNQSYTTVPLTVNDNNAVFEAFLQTASYTISGTMSSNEFWFTSPVTLTGNVTIPAGVTLTVDPNITVNLNGYRINVNGTLNLDEDARIVPSFCSENTSTGQKTYYPSLSAAIAAIDEPWYKLTVNDTCLLSQNVSISGHSFEIGPKADINLNGHNLTIDWANDGNLTGVAAGAQINPDLRLLAPNQTILGFYGNLSDAFSDGSLVELRDTLTATGNLSVPSGKTLKTQSGSVLKFNSGISLNISGNLLSNSTIFTNTSDTWGGIRFQSGSGGTLSNCTITKASYGVKCENSTPTIKGCDISNSTYGMHFSSSANPTVNQCTIEDCSYGLYLSGASPVIDSCTVSDCSTYGLYVYNSSPDLNTNRISNSRVYLNSCGYASVFTDNLITGQTQSGMNAVFMYNSSPHFYYNTINVEDAIGIEVSGGHPVFGEWAAYGYNILDNDPKNDGILWATNNAWVVLGYGPPDMGPYEAASNTIYGGYSPLAALGSSSIDATHCYWGQNPAPACYGNVNTWSELDSLPFGSGSSLSKSAVPNLIAQDNPNVSTADSLFYAAYALINKEEHASALVILNEIIHRFQDSPYAYKALHTSLRLCADHKAADGIGLLDDLHRSVDDPDLRTFALSQKVSQLREKGNMPAAIALSETILSDSREGSYALTSLFDLFNMYHKDLGNNEMAMFYLDELKARYPESALTLIARSDMGENVSNIKLVKRVLPEEPLIEQETILPQAFALHHAYPNPFNPSTCIRVELPESGELVLDILDIRGRVVDHMMLNKQAGTHEIPYAPKQLSTGIYFIRARFKDQIQMRKIMYLK
ncbi:MAG: NosD domain-containing protein [Petrimonas sp.]|nr:NosD domain-containing protein [Candidatus Neomarinimicrobiota bacterium]MDD5709465.1 NosD domain-containing protein [Candidatus Neomarinimicrobiota bacterium]MDX9775917.1 NosD domain-containing protein [Petrimonas sp.]